MSHAKNFHLGTRAQRTTHTERETVNSETKWWFLNGFIAKTKLDTCRRFQTIYFTFFFFIMNNDYIYKDFFSAMWENPIR